MMKKLQPSSLEMQVLAVLWRHGPLSARQVLEKLPDKKERAYTTVLSVLQVMEGKGFLGHESVGNRYIYRPAVAKTDILGAFLKNMVTTLFGGSPAHALQHLLQAGPLSEAEVREMRKLLEQHTQKPGS